MKILLSILDDLLTKERKSHGWHELPANSTLAELDPMTFGQGGGVVVLRNGDHVPADDWAGTILFPFDHVSIAPAPGDGSTIFLAAVAIASAAASMLLAPKFRAVDSSTDAPQERATFNKVSSPALAGEVMPVVFGRVPRFGGKVVSVVPVNDGNGDARLKVLLDFGRGPIKAIGSIEADDDDVDLATISGLWLNDTEAAKYAHSRASVRLGTAGQAIIPGFDDDEVLVEVGAGGFLLRNTTGSDLPDATPGSEVITFTTTGPVDAVIPRVALTQGLFNTTTSGQMEPRRVVYRVATKASGSGTWSAWTTVTVERAEQSRFVSAPRVAVQTPGLVHEVRVERVSKEPAAASLVERDELRWEQVVEVTETSNNYEGHALLALDLSASDQFTDVPEVGADVQGYAALRVWDGSSSPASPTFSTGYSENPAAHALELLTNEEFGLGAAYGDGNVDFASLFEAWAEADALVDRLRVGTGQRPRYRCGIAITEERPAQDWLNVICRTMRTQHFSSGGVFFFVIEKVRSVPAEVFTDGSIARGAPGDGVAGESTFRYVRELTTGGILRANRIVCQFLNETLGGRDDTASFPRAGDLWLATEPVNEKAVRLEGITDPDQAAAEAVYLLKRERFLSRSVAFTTTRAWVASRPGERFDVACTLPGWGLASGRLRPGSTASVVKLDRSVTLADATTYYLKVVQVDGSIEVREVSSPAGTYARDVEISLAAALSQAPAVTIPSDGAEYSIGEADVQVKPFTCTRVTSDDADELAWSIEGVEYDDEVHDDAAEEVEMPEYSSLGRAFAPPGPVQSLTANEVLVTRGTATVREVTLAWTQTPADAALTATFRIYRRVVGTVTWVLTPEARIGTRGAVIDITDVDRAYDLAVVGVSLAGNSLSPDSPGVPRVTIVYGLSAPPPEPPEDLVATQISGNRYRLEWTEADEAVQYQVLSLGDATSLPNVGAEDCLVVGRTSETFYDLVLPPGESCTFWVRSVGRSGRLSWTASSVTVADPDEPTGQAIKASLDLDIENDGTLTNLVWNGTDNRLELDDLDEVGEHVTEELDLTTDTLTEITLRPHTRNDADDLPVEDLTLAVPSIEADQWGIVSVGPKVVGMLMPPWPDARQAWTFEVRTKGASGAWSVWSLVPFGTALSRVCRYVQVRVRMTREKVPYRPALAGLTVVATH